MPLFCLENKKITRAKRNELFVQDTVLLTRTRNVEAFDTNDEARVKHLIFFTLKRNIVHVSYEFNLPTETLNTIKIYIQKYR